MNFIITVRTAAKQTKYIVIADSSIAAFAAAADAQGDTPCGITVRPIGAKS